METYAVTWVNTDYETQGYDVCRMSEQYSQGCAWGGFCRRYTIEKLWIAHGRNWFSISPQCHACKCIE